MKFTPCLIPMDEKISEMKFTPSAFRFYFEDIDRKFIEMAITGVTPLFRGLNEYIGRNGYVELLDWCVENKIKHLVKQKFLTKKEKAKIEKNNTPKKSIYKIASFSYNDETLQRTAAKYGRLEIIKRIHEMGEVHSSSYIGALKGSSYPMYKLLQSIGVPLKGENLDYYIYKINNVDMYLDIESKFDRREIKSFRYLVAEKNSRLLYDLVLRKIGLKPDMMKSAWSAGNIDSVKILSEAGLRLPDDAIRTSIRRKHVHMLRYFGWELNFSDVHTQSMHDLFKNEKNIEIINIMLEHGFKVWGCCEKVPMCDTVKKILNSHK